VFTVFDAPPACRSREHVLGSTGRLPRLTFTRHDCARLRAFTSMTIHETEIPTDSGAPLQRNSLLLRVASPAALDPQKQVAALMHALPGIPAVLHGANIHDERMAVIVEVFPDTVLAAGEFILRLRGIGEVDVLSEPGAEWVPLRSEQLFRMPPASTGIAASSPDLLHYQPESLTCLPCLFAVSPERK
jgi:hypothetical protein